ncbi:hypothetical protein [Planomonospora venezuelensis]|uniref:2-phosphoglycerate kinase n=1 Tax=Planomonospora venezuelensis TaxID=1999 RepID=A0A841DB97_PLAVE|nr:2-phosphoglycerate kinase [Planomonospora venezuelensis]
MTRNWKVLLIAGASGTGKSRVSYPLARHYGVPIVEVDDIVEALQAMTTPEQQPLLHHWRTRPEDADLPADEIAALQAAVAEALVPAVEAVVANHLETGTPAVVEGDYLLPRLAVREGVAGIVLHEPDPEQLVENYLRREPGAGEQRGRAVASARYGDWLAERAGEAGVPVVAARPWDDSVRRIIDVLGG